MYNVFSSRNSTLIVCFASLLFFSPHVRAAQRLKKPDQEKIGTVMGQTVYRDQIRTGKKINRRDELFRLFAQPVKENYIRDHRKELEPSEKEIAFAAAYFSKDEKIRQLDRQEKTMIRQQLLTIEKQLNTKHLTTSETQELKSQQTELQASLAMPCRTFARFMLDHWKFQRHLYFNYGRGRILFQQAGIEAFDAMYQWLQDREKQGEFSIDDPKLHTLFYNYWTTQKHGNFLTIKPERIQEFLKPKWVPESSRKEPPGKKEKSSTGFYSAD